MKSVGVIGTGSWGTTVALLISQNIKNNIKFNPKILLWGVEEKYENINLSELINTKHINEKYMPGVHLGENIKCTSEYSDLSDINILVVALPHQYINTMTKFKEICKKKLIILSVVKGFMEENGSFVLISEYLQSIFNEPVNVLMGANIAQDVAKGLQNNILYKCEGTIGYSKESDKDVLYEILNNEMYKITCVKDIKGVEICGALKNIVALGYGLLEGLGSSGNTKAAFLRCGLIEMKNFAETFYPETRQETFLESCGVADLIVSCQSGRNYKFGKFKALNNESIEEFEFKIGCQKIQGVGTALCVYNHMKMDNLCEKFPIFSVVYKIFCKNGDKKEILHSF